MTSYAEIEIALRRSDAGSYQAELRFTDPEDEAERPPARGTAAFDLAELLALHHQPDAYGQALAESLFGENPRLRELYGKARAAVEAAGRTLRFRLFIRPSAAELHALRWELLHDPETGRCLATSEHTLFSRFLVSHDWRPVRLRPKEDLKALVAVSAPSNAGKYKLAEIEKDDEIARARDSLAGIAVTFAGAEEPLTLGRLVAGLRDATGRGVDILYLVCHGLLNRRQVPHVVLQNDDGTAAPVAGQKLADRIADLSQPPRLVVLASCQSGGTESGTDAEGRATALSSLAPRLARAGVPGILAMQGRISMETIKEAMPVFFRELLVDGQIDRALAVARGHVRDRPDAWMPALYLRLKRGLIWYEPGFAGVRDDFEKWSSICEQARRGKLIPILGPDLGAHVWGTSRELARGLAAGHGFPMAPHERDDLAKVAQYLVINQDRQYAQRQVLKQFSEMVVARHPDLAAGGVGKDFLDRVVEQHLRDEDDVYRILADLDSEIYVAASPETVLEKALETRGRPPETLFCHWRSTPTEHPAPPRRERDGEPTRDRPVVYYVFGVFPRWSSVVLTEDEFFDYLIASSSYRLVPEVVTGSLTEGSLIFLGFQLNDWRFRVLFRQIMTLGGSYDLRHRTHVGVQVNPEGQSVEDVRRACRYLEKYFATDRGVGLKEPAIDIYWGSPEDFLRELKRQLAKPRPQAVKTDEPVEGWF